MSRAYHVQYLLAGLAGIAGCSASVPPSTPIQSAWGQAGNEVLFPQAGAILEGIDPVETDSQWRIGDQLLYGMRLVEASRVTTRYALVTLKTPVLATGTTVWIHPAASGPCGPEEVPLGQSHVCHGDAPPRKQSMEARNAVATCTFQFEGKTEQVIKRNTEFMMVAIDLYDEHARLLDTSFALAPEAMLRGGLYGIAQAAKEFSPSRAGAAQIVEIPPERMAEIGLQLCDASNTLRALYLMLWSCDNLQPLLRSVVRIPPLFAMLRHGAEPMFELMDSNLPSTCPSAAPGTDQALPLSLQLKISDAPNLDLILDVVPPHPPLQLAGGVLAIRGRSVRDPDTSIHVRLLSARRGPKPPGDTVGQGH